MADNYLENQREQYEARKAAWKQSQKYAKKKTPAINEELPTGTENFEAKTEATQKRVFVTGGAAGIGRAIVTAFCQSGYRVAFCDNNQSLGQQTAEESGALFYKVDVSNKDALENCMQAILTKWGDIDILINNVGVSTFTPITDTSVEEFDQIISINLRTVFITSRLLAIHRKAQSLPSSFGRIINICSTRYLMSEPDTEAYAASKGGIYSMTHALAMSLAPLKITVNCISPSWIETGNYSNLRSEDHAQHPSGRVGKPEDISRLCLFLSDDKNDFINGENITVDGGMTKKMIYIE